MNKQTVTRLIVLLLALALAACGGQEPVAEEPTEALTEAADGMMEEEPTPTEAAPTEQAASTAGEAVTIDFTYDSGLADLSAYRANLVLDIVEATDSLGEPVEGQLEFWMAKTSDPAIEHMSIEATGNVFEEGAVKMQAYSLDNMIHMQNTADAPWVSVAVDEGEEDPLDRSLVLASTIELPQSARLAPEMETIEGVEARHYIFTEQDFLESDELSLEDTRGDVWVAEEGNYIVRFELQSTGNYASGRMFDTGTVHISYRLTDINADFEIPLPENMLAAAPEAEADPEAEELAEEPEPQVMSELAGHKEGLETLNSYRAQAIMEIGGVSGSGQPVEASLDVALDWIKEPPTTHFAIVPTGALSADTQETEIYEVEGTTYVKSVLTGDEWVILPEAGEQEDQVRREGLNPVNLVELPQAADRAEEPETLNGVSVYHYTFDETDLDTQDADLESAQGDIWVAVEGEYIVKYSLDTSGRFPPIRGEIEVFTGTTTIEYELTDINADLEITAPEGAVTMEELLMEPPPPGEAESESESEGP